MKKSIYLLLLSAWLTLPMAMASNGTENETNDSDKPLTHEQARQRIQQIEERVMTIYRADRSELSQATRDNLKKELKAAKREIKAVKREIDGGIYLSTAALIIIILVLVILL